MIPQLIAGIGLVTITFELVSGAAAAGTGYGLGRKYGRKLCTALDKVESTVVTSIDKFRN
tara:strand:- start:610 stop:789 length:180 start_codon:yes stop_codon:yes gene_type:complete